MEQEPPAPPPSNNNPFRPFFDQHQRCVILDGGLGSLLEQEEKLDPLLWSAQLVRSNPARIKAAHLAYLTAGADVCTTASYQATVDGFMQDGTTTRAQAEALLGRAVDLAREARDEFWAAASSHPGSNKKKRVRPLVAASVGCYGASLADGSEYRGTYGLTPEELMAWHRPRLRLLARTGGADLLAFETVPCAAEVLALLRLVQEPDTCGGLPCWLTVACRDGAHLNSGESLAACAAHVAALDPGPAPRVVAFGVNCTPPQHVAQCLQVIRGALGGDDERLLLCYPNSGEVWTETKEWQPGSGPCPTPEAFAALAEEWVAAGARVVGGCCRTTPATIQALRTRLIGDG